MVNWSLYGNGQYPIHGYSSGYPHPYPHYIMCPCPPPMGPWVYAYPYTPKYSRYINERTQDDELVPIIIQTTEKPLLQRYPYKIEDWRQFEGHPYRKELQQKYKSFLNRTRQLVPYLKERFTYDTLFSGMALTVPKSAIAKLKGLPFVKDIYLDHKVTFNRSEKAPVPEQKHAAIQQDINERNLELINVPPVREMQGAKGQPLDGRGITIAVIDSGINLSADPRFKDQVVDQYNFVNKNRDISDTENHGTVVTKIILDVAPKSQILGYKVNMISHDIAALERAAQKGVDIINFSMRAQRKFSRPTVIAVKVAVNAGAVFVSSVGNEGSRSTSFLSTAPYVLAVGATTLNGDKVAKYSSYGIGENLIKPDVVAPGTYIMEGKSRSGTSFAAPYVSGSVALIKQKHPRWGPVEFKSALATTATRIENGLSQGSGRINVLNAIQTNTLISPINMVVSAREELYMDITNQSEEEKKYNLQWNWKRLGTTPITEIVIAPSETEKVSLQASTGVKSGDMGLLEIYSSGEKWHVVMQFQNKFKIGKTEVTSVAYSPDGKRIASGSGAGKVQVWDVENESSQPLYSFVGGKEITSVAFSPDGKRVASGSEFGLGSGKVQIWDVESESSQPLYSFVGKRITSVAFSPDGKLVASGSFDNKVQIWNVESESSQPLYSFYVDDTVFSVAFSPDGKHVASGSFDNKVQIWNVENKSSQPLYSFDVDNTVFSVAFSPDGKHVASGSRGGKVQIWNVENGSPDALYTFHVSSTVSSIAYSPDGKLLASGSHSGKVQIWNVESGSADALYTFQVSSKVNSIAYSPDGEHVASGYSRGTVRIWDL